MTMQVVGLPQFQKKVGQFATNAPQADRKIVQSVALVAKTSVLVNTSPKSLSRFNRGRGITLKANYRLRSDSSGASAIILPTPPGPWYLLESGGDAHQIGRRGSRRGARRNQRGFLGNPSTGFAAVGPVQHPGSPAQHTWSRAVAPAISSGQKLYRNQAARTYLSMF